MDDGRTRSGDRIWGFVLTEGEASSWAHFKHVEEVFWTHRASLLETLMTLHATSSSSVVSVRIVLGSLLVIAERLRTGLISCMQPEQGACRIHWERATHLVRFVDLLELLLSKLLAFRVLVRMPLQRCLFVSVWQRRQGADVLGG